MSLLVLGMDMPEDGVYTVAVERGHASIFKYEDRSLYCSVRKLIQVPPNVRLIDANKAHKDAINQVSLAFVSRNKEQAAMAVAEVIRNAPTIIPEEEEKP